MSGILDGKEIEGKIGDVGAYSVDVTKEGKVIAELSVEVSSLEGAVKAKSANSVELDVFTLLAGIAKKNNKEWLGTSVESIKNILGIVG